MSEALDGTLFGEDNPCFGCAVDHASGLRLSFERSEDGVVTELQPRAEHQGPPGLMHGGLLMTLADEVGAWAVIAETGKFGFTVGFEGRIARAARVDRPLRATGRVTRSGRRLVSVEVEIEQDGQLAMRASFRFALLDQGSAERLLGRALPPQWQRFARD